jgi:hypothetical protein
MSKKLLPEDARMKTVLAFKALFEGDDEALAQLREMERKERVRDALDRLLERPLYWMLIGVIVCIVIWLIATFR